MSRFERRPGSIYGVVDSIASLQATLQEGRAYQVIATNKNGTISGGQLFLADTSKNDMAVTMSPTSPIGLPMIAIANGTGSLNVKCPPGFTFLNGSVATLITADYDKRTLIRLPNHKFVAFS